ncbi:MAG: metallophosphoesterase [Dehalococcoidia bacterium]|nr:metallophosphoesterase [Dehalococcoidia bacterium]
MRVLFFADTHLGFDYPVQPRVSRRHRGQGFFDNFRGILDYAERTRPDLVVHGGDLFFRRRVPPKIVDMVYETLLQFSETGIPTEVPAESRPSGPRPADCVLSPFRLSCFNERSTGSRIL